MKKNLGRVLSLLFFFVSLEASMYSWNTYVNKKEPYVNESIYLKFTCEFDDNGELFIIDFEPRSTEFYEIYLLSKGEKLKEGKRINSFEYILKPKVAQNIEISLEATMKQTTMESIVDNTTNHYDDTKFDSIHKKTLVKMERIKLNVLKTPKTLIGDFSIQVTKDNAAVKAYEPYHLDVEISGEGNFEALKSIEYDIKNVKTFTQKPIQKTTLTKDGYKGVWSQKFAFVSDSNFKIPLKKIEYFNASLGEVHTLNIDSIDVNVNRAYKKAELLDAVEEKGTFNREYLYFLFIFIAGFLAGKIKLHEKKLSRAKQGFIDKVNKAKSINEVSMIVIMSDEKKFASIVENIEENKSQSLSQIKKMVTKLV